MPSNKKYEPRKKNAIIKTLQWFGVSIVSILLIIYFLVVDTSGGQKTPVIGSVNRQPIYYTSTSPYGRAFKQIESRYQSIGIKINNEMYRYIEDLAFRIAVSSILLDNIAKKNIVVSDNFVIEAIKSEFIDTNNGTYNQMAYESFIKNITQAEQLRIEKDIRGDILTQTIASELFTSIKYNSIDMQMEYKKNFTKRDIEMLYIDVATIVENSEINSNDLEKYFNDNKTNFIQADISWIVLESGAVADNLYRTLKDNISLLDKNALEKSIYSNNYKLGYITKMEMPSQEFASKIFANNKIETLLEPIYDNGLYYVVFINGIRVPEKYIDINQDILRKEYFNDNMQILLESEKIKQAEALKYAIDGINNIKSLDGNGYIKYYRASAPFSYNQGRLNTIEGVFIPDSSTEVFYNNVFKLKNNDISEVIKLNNGVAVMRLISEEKPDMNMLNTLDIFTRNSTKRELSRQRVNYIRNEWENQEMAKARIKKYKIR